MKWLNRGAGFLLMYLALPSPLRAEDEALLAVEQQVEKIEMIRPPNNLIAPDFHVVPDPAGGEFVLMSSAMSFSLLCASKPVQVSKSSPSRAGGRICR
jgi:hypothetical protein